MDWTYQTVKLEQLHKLCFYILKCRLELCSKYRNRKLNGWVSFEAAYKTNNCESGIDVILKKIKGNILLLLLSYTTYLDFFAGEQFRYCISFNIYFLVFLETVSTRRRARIYSTVWVFGEVLLEKLDRCVFYILICSKPSLVFVRIQAKKNKILLFPQIRETKKIFTWAVNIFLINFPEIFSFIL